MRKLLAALAVVAISVPLAWGAGGLGIFGSYWDMDDPDDEAIGGGLKFKMEMAPQILLELRASYLTEFGPDEPGYDFADANLVPLEADIVVDFPLVEDQLTLYAGGGGGYYISPEFEAEILGVEGDVDFDDEFGFFVVGGVELMLSEQVSLFGEAKHTWLELEEVESDFGDEEDIELELTGLGVNAGLLLVW